MALARAWAGKADKADKAGTVDKEERAGTAQLESLRPALLAAAAGLGWAGTADLADMVADLDLPRPISSL